MAGGYRTWPLVQFNVIGEAWRLYKRHWVVWSLTALIVTVCFLRGVRYLHDDPRWSGARRWRGSVADQSGRGDHPVHALGDG